MGCNRDLQIRLGQASVTLASPGTEGYNLEFSVDGKGRGKDISIVSSYLRRCLVVAQKEMQDFLDEHPEIAEAMRVLDMSAEVYARAMQAVNPVVRYTSTSTRDLGPDSDK